MGKRRDDLLEMIEELKRGPCMDCGKTFDPVCMDFDHRPGTKKVKGVAGLARSAGATRDLMLNEIRKCDLVCACCHRLRTKKRPMSKIGRKRISEGLKRRHETAIEDFVPTKSLHEMSDDEFRRMEDT